jgi:hypothetical protein
MMALLKNFIKRFVRRKDRWSIGIYVGDSPYHFWQAKNVRNPVLTAKDVTDRKAEFVADPFMVKEQGIWYMFFEVLNRTTQKGEIGFAESLDGFRWKYQRIVLSEPFHLSYPYVFKWENEFYMIPESYEKKVIRLYKASHFPDQWEFSAELLKGSDFQDSSIFYYEKIWLLFTCPTLQNDVLKLFYAENLKGPWFEHPANPVVAENSHIARPGGRVLVLGDKVIRYTQDDHPVYGGCLNAFEITKLTMADYEEKEYQANPMLKASRNGWNKDGMHHIDPHHLRDDVWIACVDGNTKHLRLRITPKT